MQCRPDRVRRRVDHIRICVTGVIRHDHHAVTLIQLVTNEFLANHFDLSDIDFSLLLSLAKRPQPIHQGRAQAWLPNLRCKSHSVAIHFSCRRQSIWFSCPNANNNACVPSFACPWAATA